MTAAKRLTVDDLWALGPDVRAELIDGEIIPKVAPSYEHSFAEGAMAGWLWRRFHRASGTRWPGGWWLGPEVHVVYRQDLVYCHDLAGWRRDRVPTMPKGWVHIRPDWVCEVLSPKHEKRDLVDKMRALHSAEVPHYWIMNREEKVLSIYRYEPDGYLLVRSASTGETIRAEPFDAVELRTAVLFDDEDDEE